LAASAASTLTEVPIMTDRCGRGKYADPPTGGAARQIVADPHESDRN
jgi:hypothetical protein